MRGQTRRHGKAEKKRGSLLATLCLLTALAFVLSTGAVSLARYAMERRKDDVAVAAPFYFVCDKLSADESLPYTQLPQPVSGDTVEITFTLSNHIDDLRCSQKNIAYTCDAYAGEDQIPGAHAEGTLSGGEKEDDLVTLTIKKSQLEEGRVTVAAKATSPYAKELKGEFGFAAGEEASGLQTDLREENGAVVLEVVADITLDQVVEIIWPEGLTPDPSCLYLDKNSYGSVDLSNRTAQVAGPLDGRFSASFLKTDPDQSYEESDFQVSVKRY